jgi:hypothetical protein
MKTGNSGTISLSSSAISMSFTKIGEWQTTRNKLEASHLGTVGLKEYVPDDLAEPGEVEVEGFFDPRNDLPNINAAAETITITYPKEATGATAATLAGSGFLTMLSRPELVNGTLSKAKFKVAFDGYTGPAFTKESGSSGSP